MNMKRRLGLVASIFECLLFCGVCLGWCLLIPIFKNAGYFSNVCTGNTTDEIGQDTTILPNVNLTPPNHPLEENSFENLGMSELPGRSKRDEHYFVAGDAIHSSLWDISRRVLWHLANTTETQINNNTADYKLSLESNMEKHRGNNDSRNELKHHPRKRGLQSIDSEHGETLSMASSFEHDLRRLSFCADGEFKPMCCAVVHKTCQEQEDQLIKVDETSSVIVHLAAFPGGWFFDKHGTLKTRLIAIAMYAPATLLVTFSNPETSWLLYPATCMIAVSGMLIFMTDLQMANYFKRRCTVLTLFVGAYYSSTVVFYIIKMTSDGCAIHFPFMFLTCGIVLYLITTIACLPKSRAYWPLIQKDNTRRRSSCSSVMSVNTSDKKFKIKKSPFRDVLFSYPFISQVVWFVCLHFRLTIYETTMDIRLKQLNMKETWEHVIFYGQMGAIFIVPIFGHIVDIKRSSNYKASSIGALLSFIVGTSLMSFLGLIVAILDSQPHSVTVQFAVLIIHAFMRPTLTGISIASITSLFPSEHFGKLYGITMSAAGVADLLKFPLDYVWKLQATNNDAVIWLNVVMAVTTICSVAFPAVLCFCRQKCLMFTSGNPLYKVLRVAPGVSSHHERSESQSTFATDGLSERAIQNSPISPSPMEPIAEDERTSSPKVTKEVAHSATDCLVNVDVCETMFGTNETRRENHVDNSVGTACKEVESTAKDLANASDIVKPKNCIDIGDRGGKPDSTSTSFQRRKSVQFKHNSV